MTIRNLEHYNKALWDWGCLAGCFPGKNSLSDLDGIIERRGHFLVIEGKTNDAPLRRGQERLFDALLATGRFTVIVVWGWPGVPERLRVCAWYEGRVVRRDYPHADLETLRGLARRWYQFADGFSQSNKSTKIGY